jgi:DNA-binding transcriptional LysR family regulator
LINKVHGGLRGTVRLGIMQREPSLSIPRLITEFRLDHPRVDVELHRGSSATHARDLRKGRLALAFVALESGTGLTLTEWCARPCNWFALQIIHSPIGPASS